MSSRGGRIVRVVAAVPTPPPWSGPEINGARLLAEGLGPGIQLRHLRTSIGGRNEAKGRATAGNLTGGFRLVVRALVILTRVRPEVVYLYLSQNPTGFLRDAVIIWLARLSGARVVAHVRGANFRNFYDSLTGWRRRLVAATVSRLTRVILVADRLRPQFTGLFPDDRIRVVGNAVESWTAPRPAEGFRILFMGHLSHAKGFALVVAAAGIVLERVADAELVVAGEWLELERNILADEQGRPLPGDQAALRRAWDELRGHFPDRVTYLGVVTGEQKRAAFGSSAVFVLPSYSEGLPMVVLEAMAGGLPVVVTPVGALPELLTDGLHGAIVPLGDVDALVDALLALAGDRQRAAAIGEHNRAFVERACSPVRIRESLAAVLVEAAA